MHLVVDDVDPLIPYDEVGMNPMALSRRAFLATSGAAVSALGAAGCGSGSGGGDEVTFLVDNNPNGVASAEALVEAFNANQPEGPTFSVDSRPGGTEGDNLVKTRLGTQDMPDVFLYNSGSLFQAIKPVQFLTDLSAEPWVDTVVETFLPSVTAEGGVYGAPIGSAIGGTILYHKPTYEKMGLEVPLTWDDFISNCQAIKAAGSAAPVIQSYGDTPSSQIILLADFHNVAAANPDFAEQYTAHEVGFADDPVALRGFEKTEQIIVDGLVNDDYVSATYQQAIEYIATGNGVHYPTLSGALAEIVATHPDTIDDVGFFAVPGDDAATNGLTVWLPSGLYIPKSAENLDAAKAFLAFAVTVEGLDALNSAAQPTGPSMVKDIALPEDVPAAVQDLQAYFDEDGRTTPALEFSSPIKGPNLENILIELGTGAIDAKTAAERYDQDVEKQAQQLGLEGW